MTDINYQQAADGVHEIVLNTPSIEGFSSVLESIAQLYQIDAKPAYVIVDLRVWLGLPVIELGVMLRDMLRKYANQSHVFVAIIIDISAANVVSNVWKTILKRSDVQYFTLPEKAKVWLNLERRKFESK